MIGFPFNLQFSDPGFGVRDLRITMGTDYPDPGLGLDDRFPV